MVQMFEVVSDIESVRNSTCAAVIHFSVKVMVTIMIMIMIIVIITIKVHTVYNNLASASNKPGHPSRTEWKSCFPIT
jgi:hypothetical protein